MNVLPWFLRPGIAQLGGVSWLTCVMVIFLTFLARRPWAPESGAIATAAITSAAAWPAAPRLSAQRHRPPRPAPVSAGCQERSISSLRCVLPTRPGRRDRSNAGASPLTRARRAIGSAGYSVSSSPRSGSFCLSGEDRLEQVALLLDALDRRRDLEAELLGVAALGRPLDLPPVQRDRGGRVARGRAASRRRSSSSSGGSGSSRRRPCRAGRPSPSSRRPPSGSASRAAGRPPWRTGWSARRSPWCSAGSRPAGPCRRRPSGSPPGRTRRKSSRTRRATLQHSTRPAGAPGSRSKASTVGCSMRVDFESEGWSSRAASCAIQIRVGRFSQRQKSISPARRST